MEEVNFDIYASYYYGVVITKTDLSDDKFETIMNHGGNCLSCGIVSYMRSVYGIKISSIDDEYIHPEKCAICFAYSTKNRNTKVLIADLQKMVDTLTDNDNIDVALTNDEYVHLKSEAQKMVASCDILPNIDEDTYELRKCMEILGINKELKCVYDIFQDYDFYFCDGCGESISYNRYNKSGDDYDLCEKCFENESDKSIYQKRACCFYLKHVNRTD